MIESASSVSERLVELRRDFDRSFVAAPRAKESAEHELLAIRIGNERYALRLSDIAGLFVDKKIVRVPGGGRALLGMAGFRGALVPVYGLRSLLGIAAAGAPRWLVIAATAPVGFSFEGFEGQLRVAAAAVTPQQAQDKTNFTQDLVRAEGMLRPVIRLSAVFDAIMT
jgi:chemotaxis signal transduction protein